MPLPAPVMMATPGCCTCPEMQVSCRAAAGPDGATTDEAAVPDAAVVDAAAGEDSLGDEAAAPGSRVDEAGADVGTPDAAGPDEAGVDEVGIGMDGRGGIGAGGTMMPRGRGPIIPCEARRGTARHGEAGVGGGRDRQGVVRRASTRKSSSPGRRV